MVQYTIHFRDFVEEFRNASESNKFVETKTDLDAVDVSKTERLLGTVYTLET